VAMARQNPAESRGGWIKGAVRDLTVPAYSVEKLFWQSDADALLSFP
jgi:hypothetical protein